MINWTRRSFFSIHTWWPAAFFLKVWLLSIAISPAHAAEQLTLADALRLASQHNPTIQASRQEIKTALAQYEIARGAFLPRLTATGTYVNTNRPSQAFGILLDQGRFTAADFAINSLNNPGLTENFQSSIRLEQPVYNGGRELLGIALAEVGQTVSQEHLEETRQHMLFQVATAYYNLALAKVHVGVAKETLDIAKANLRHILSRYREGTTVKSDVLHARVRLAAHQEQVVRATQRVAVAQLRLQHAIGIDEEIDTVETLTGGPLPPLNRQQLITTALAQRPDYRQLRAEMARAELAVRLAQSTFLPSMNLHANYELNATAPFSPNGSNNYAIFGIISLNLFNGLVDMANVRKAKAQAKKIQHLLEATRRRIEVEVVEASSQLTAAAERLRVTQQAIDEAKENLRIVRNRYDTGLASVLELFTAELILREAKILRLRALYDFHVNRARLDLVTGKFHQDRERSSG
ncbi:MAG: TolC family protein [Nitrospirae bacterium]|nr:MAG: TolC family protein [Nitrospirota bacterium]